MLVLVINCGSSSVKYDVIETEERRDICRGIVERIGAVTSILKHEPAGKERIKETKVINDHGEALQEILNFLLSDEAGVLSSPSDIKAVGHRVVHGGEMFKDSVLIDDVVKDAIKQAFDLAPLHNPPNLKGIQAAQERLSDIPHVAVFDTAFHHSLPPHAYLYGIPNRLYRRHKIRKYGFHGTSHYYVSRQYYKLTDKPRKDTKIITCHLGNGASIAAIKGGESIDTSMGFTPLSGMVMGTAADMRDMAGTLDKIAAGMTRGYAGRSGKTEDEIAALMAAETWFSAAEALEAGLATQLAEPVRIAARFDIARFRNAPPALVDAVEASEPEDDATAPDIVDDANDVAAPPDAATQPGAHVPDATAAAASTGPDPASIRAEAIAHARAVVDLCRLAGQPQMAGRFLEEDASLDAVRTALLDEKAEGAPEITPHHPQPGRSAATRPWGDVIARTFKLKG